MKKYLLKVGCLALILGAAIVARPSVAQANLAYWDVSYGCYDIYAVQCNGNYCRILGPDSGCAFGSFSPWDY